MLAPMPDVKQQAADLLAAMQDQIHVATPQL